MAPLSVLPAWPLSWSLICTLTQEASRGPTGPSEPRDGTDVPPWSPTLRLAIGCYHHPFSAKASQSSLTPLSTLKPNDWIHLLIFGGGVCLTPAWVSLVLLQLHLTTHPSPSLGLVPVPSPHHNHCGLSKTHIWWGLPPPSKAPLLTAWSGCALTGVRVIHRFLNLALWHCSIAGASVYFLLCASVPLFISIYPSSRGPATSEPPAGPSCWRIHTLLYMCACSMWSWLWPSGDRKLLGDGDCIMFMCTPKAEHCACHIDARLLKGKAITLKC